MTTIPTLREALAKAREEIARVIDPYAWKNLDTERARPTKTHKNKEPWSWLNYYTRACEPSLTKADAILAKLNAPSEGPKP